MREFWLPERAQIRETGCREPAANAVFSSRRAPGAGDWRRQGDRARRRGSLGPSGRACRARCAHRHRDRRGSGRDPRRWRPAEPLVLDVTDTRAVAESLESRPAFDILVNNAGTNRPRPFLDVTEDDFDAIMDLNVRAAFFVAQAVARRILVEGRRGSIIHVSSQMGHVGAALRTVYCASKHAIEGLTKAMAVDLAPHGIRVNSIGPTFIETPLARSFLSDPAFREDVLRRIKLGRLGTVEDLMGAIVFLASDAAALMTGTALVVDGGWTAE